jgi:hypothetical protein
VAAVDDSCRDMDCVPVTAAEVEVSYLKSVSSVKSVVYPLRTVHLNLLVDDAGVDSAETEGVA